MPDSDQAKAGYPAGLGRRLGAMLYDSLLLLALWLMAAAPLVITLDGLAPWASRALIISVWAGFYGYSWNRGGQTLGMAAWRIHLLDSNGQPPTWRHIGLRLLTAPLSFFCIGLGYVWLYVSKTRQTWHDQLSQTMVVHIPKDK